MREMPLLKDLGVVGFFDEGRTVRGEAGVYRQQIVDRTNAEARQIVGEADQRLSKDVAVAREQIVRESESLALEAATRILGRAV